MQEAVPTRWSDTLHWNRPDTAQPRDPYCLVCIHPSDRLGQVIKLAEGELAIGREAGCDLELTDDSVSRRHALLQSTEQGFVVIDLGSTNGTYVNDTRVQTQALVAGDRVRFGNQIFKYLSPDGFESEYFETAYRMMTTDGLTQAHNRRYLVDVAQRELRRSRRTGRSLSVLMIDIDRFKSINDTYGHSAGDEVLIELCRRLRVSLRADEVFARYGGEEFCLVLPETGLADALDVAERLRKTVADQTFATEKAELAVTVSIGAACAEPASTISAEELMERADRHLYAAKRAGRNRVSS